MKELYYKDALDTIIDSVFSRFFIIITLEPAHSTATGTAVE